MNVSVACVKFNSVAYVQLWLVLTLYPASTRRVVTLSTLSLPAHPLSLPFFVLLAVLQQAEQ